jgi:hypothetical protein
MGTKIEYGFIGQSDHNLEMLRFGGGNPIDYKVGETYIWSQSDDERKKLPKPRKKHLNLFVSDPPGDSRYFFVKREEKIDDNGNTVELKLNIIKEVAVDEYVDDLIEVLESTDTKKSKTAKKHMAIDQYEPMCSVVSDTSYNENWVIDQINGTSPSDRNSVILNNGDMSAVVNTKCSATAINNGPNSIAGITHAHGLAVTKRGHSVAVNNGSYGVSVNKGDYGVASTVGEKSLAINTGISGIACNTSDGKSLNRGDKGVAVCTGYKSEAVSSGEYSVALTHEDDSKAEVIGNNSVAISIGVDSKVKAVDGSGICLVSWVYDESIGKNVISGVYAAKVGDKILDTTIEADTWYWFSNGNLKSENA